MKRKPKHIERPTLKSAKKLSALDLNKIKVSRLHTPITPEALEQLADKAST